jgi:hypothetical protein
MRQLLIAYLLCALTSITALAENDPELALLPDDPYSEDFFYTCSACHSLKTVTQQRLNRKRWADTLEWMVEEGGMAELDEEELEPMLDYLSTYYGEDTPR